MKTNHLKIKDAGFTYISLIIGVAVLMIALGFFTSLFRSSRINMSIAEEKMAMATAAQNMAQVYIATNNKTTAENQGASQGFDSVSLAPAAPHNGLIKVTITVSSNRTVSDPRYVEPYVLVFEIPEMPE